MIHLETIERKPGRPGREGFPFTVPVVRALERLDVAAPVTFFVGENGSGKSTLLEAIALATNLPVVGSAEGGRDPTLAAQRDLALALTLSWRRRTHRGFFLRAEDFFGFQRRLAKERAELAARLQEIDEAYRDRSGLARDLARGPVTGSLADMERRYGEDPDARSHGEAFLQLFSTRLVANSLVLLDEPEAALSPQNQIGLLALMLAMVQEGVQFIVATHSPIVLGYPGARIYSFDGGRIAAVPYRELDHVRLTQEFLTDPDRVLRHLVE
ncbi:MAG: ATP-binding cassette domain-containing protein [Gemmatimonadetes bacterium]|nr:ATP-binding cassette domain-containing protein [Gemmatimonadota bacterium]